MRFIHALVQFLLAAPKFPGRDWLIEKLPLWFIKSPTGPTNIKTRFGFSITVDPLFDKNIENVIYERGVYEQGTLSLLQRYLHSGDCFVDVGANIGFLSLAAAAIVGKSGEVLAFEPVPSTFEILKTNKEQNHFDQLKLYPFALGAENNELMIYEEPLNRGGASLVNQRSDKETRVEVKVLDEVISSQKVSLLKIDVEGFEFNVLKGAKQLIKRDRPVIIVEFSNDRENVGDSMEMYRWLQALDMYDFYRLEKGKERKSKLIRIVSKTGGFPEHDNIICVPTIK